MPGCAGPDSECTHRVGRIVPEAAINQGDATRIARWPAWTGGKGSPPPACSIRHGNRDVACSTGIGAAAFGISTTERGIATATRNDGKNGEHGDTGEKKPVHPNLPQ